MASARGTFSLCQDCIRKVPGQHCIKVPRNVGPEISIKIKNRKLLKIEISIWATLNRTVSYYMLVKDV